MIPSLFREGLIENLIEALPDSRDTRIMEYFRRVKKFIKGTKGRFPERVMSLKEIFPLETRQAILKDTKEANPKFSHNLAFERVFNRLKQYNGDQINAILYHDTKDSLPGDMLTKVDWMSMKNSLEVRVPFLDLDVVELAFKIPSSLKLYKGRTKYILKETFKDVLPPSLYKRPKAGFEVPISRWLKTDLKFLLHQYLAEGNIREQGIFEYKVIESLIHDLLNNKTDTSWMLWNLIVFQYWHENYFL